MLSPRFIPESVFYTQSVVRSPQSVVRSTCFILTASEAEEEKGFAKELDGNI